MVAISILLRSIGAGVHAVHAIHALLWGIGQLGFEGPRLRIMAPAAAQWAAFQENGRSDSGAIVKGETLNVEDDAVHEPASIEGPVQNLELNVA
jgi:hypothetical protein